MDGTVRRMCEWEVRHVIRGRRGAYGDFWCFVDVGRVVLWWSCVRKQNSSMMGARRHTKSGSAENLGYCDMSQVPPPTCAVFEVVVLTMFQVWDAASVSRNK